MIDTSNICVNKIVDTSLEQKQVQLHVLRLDKIDAIISGNKLFKLHYFIEKAIKENIKTITTFGGAYSNHLAATAYLCNQLNLNSVGIVRGECPKNLSHTLTQCMQQGMQLKFVSREDYDNKNIIVDDNNTVVIPEGGYEKLGAKGAALITKHISNEFTHIVLAVGTATTLSGILLSAKPHQQVIGVPVLKGMTDVEERIFHLTQKNYSSNKLQIWNDFHFGGYAKKTEILLNFMNETWLKHTLPLDFVYTAKAFYGVIENIKNNYFQKGSNILFIHTGGLQGNLSLNKNALVF